MARPVSCSQAWEDAGCLVVRPLAPWGRVFPRGLCFSILGRGRGKEGGLNNNFDERLRLVSSRVFCTRIHMLMMNVALEVSVVTICLDAVSAFPKNKDI